MIFFKFYFAPLSINHYNCSKGNPSLKLYCRHFLSTILLFPPYQVSLHKPEFWLRILIEAFKAWNSNRSIHEFSLSLSLEFTGETPPLPVKLQPGGQLIMNPTRCQMFLLLPKLKMLHFHHLFPREK